MKKYCFEVDEDSNWYCIPINMRDKFNELLYETDDNYEEFNNTFSSMMLNMDISNYSFENLKEIEE